LCFKNNENEQISPRFVVKHIGWSLKKANARPKPAKELAYPNTRQTETMQQIDRKTTEKMNTERLTKAICNKGFSGNSSVLPRSNFGVVGQESSSQSLTAYSLDR